MTIREAIVYAKEKINEKGLEENASLLLVEHLSGILDRTQLFLHMDDVLKEEKSFYEMLDTYLKGKPMQYVLHSSYFLSREFYVDERVLIPRMETEEVALKAISILKGISAPVIYDVCTGSGILAITCALAYPVSKVIGGDISLDALEVANKNKERFSTSNVTFLHSNLFASFPKKKADMILSNPPYIDEKDLIDTNVKENEPYIALVPPSGDGLEFYKRFFQELPSYLKEGGYFIAEFGWNQKAAIAGLASSMLPHSLITFYQDISLKDRYFVLQYFD